MISDPTTCSCSCADHTAPPPLLPVALGNKHGRRPQILIVVPYTVLLGADDPCELLGHGTITADQARPIIADGTLRRLLCDPISGTVLDYGRTRYEPPESLKQFLIARDHTCRSPGCNQPADRCQTDHVIPYRPHHTTGGTTDHASLDMKCLHHHRAKDGGGFQNTRDTDGTSHWTTPLGRKYALPPHQALDLTDTDWADRFPPELTATRTGDGPATPLATETSSTATAMPDDEPPPF